MKYLTIMNISGEILWVYRTAGSRAKAERLARIAVAKEKGLIPSPWAIKPSDIHTQEVLQTEPAHV